MKITRKKPVDSRIERQIITGMITNTRYLREVADIYSHEYLRLPYAKTIASWCIEYFSQYGEAPKSNISDLFAMHKEEQDQDQIALIADYLTEISDEYAANEKTFNVAYTFDKTEKYFRLNSLDALQSALRTALSNHDIESAEHLVATFRKVERPPAQGIDPIEDEEVIQKAFDPESGEKLFAFPGALGDMFGTFEREMFVMFVGSMGSGKTWWLMESGLRGLFAGLNVLFISLELSEKQMIRRIHHNLTASPSNRWAGSVEIPVFDCAHGPEECEDRVHEGPCALCKKDPDSNFSPIVFHTRKKRKGLSIGKALSKARALRKTVLRGKKFKLIAPPPGSMNVHQLKMLLDRWEFYDGWIPDVIVTDYVDKFAPEPGAPKEYRHRIYESVVAHKALAKERRCLVISASQSNTGRKEGQRIKSGDFAEDIRKKAEVDIAMSLNQNARQKEDGVMMISPMKIRDDMFSVRDAVMVLQQLKIGKPYLDSCLIQNVD